VDETPANTVKKEKGDEETEDIGNLKAIDNKGLEDDKIVLGGVKLKIKAIRTKNDIEDLKNKIEFGQKDEFNGFHYDLEQKDRNKKLAENL